MLLRFIAEVALISFFRLRYQDVEFGLQVFEQLSQFFIAFERLLELPLQGFILLKKALDLRLQLCILVIEVAPPAVSLSSIPYMIPYVGECHHI
jgi:hypothetical protein